MLWVCKRLGIGMIKFEHNSLVLDSSHSKEDQKAVNDFIEYKIQQELKQALAKVSGNREKSS
jgi:hypothetical protein